MKKRGVFLLLLLFFLFPSLGWSISWNKEKVDDGDNPILILDIYSHPYLAYTDNGKVKYAYRAEAGWQVEEVGNGENPTLALDANGQPHLAYTSGGKVKYAYRAEAGWQVEEVGEGENPSLALYANTQPHLTYTDNGKVKYAYTEIQEGWHMEVVDELDYQPPFWIRHRKFFIDSNDHPHIVYYITTDHGFIKHEFWDGSKWHSEEIPVEGYVIDSVLDSQDRLHFVYNYVEENHQYYNYNRYYVKYLYPDPVGSGWKTEIVDSRQRDIETEEDVNLEALSLALDSNDRPYILEAETIDYPYLRGQHVPSNTFLKVAHRGEEGWVKEIIASAAQRKTSSIMYSFGEIAPLILDSQNHLHLFFVKHGPQLSYCEECSIIDCENTLYAKNLMMGYDHLIYKYYDTIWNTHEIDTASKPDGLIVNTVYCNYGTLYCECNYQLTGKYNISYLRPFLDNEGHVHLIYDVIHWINGRGDFVDKKHKYFDEIGFHQDDLNGGLRFLKQFYIYSIAIDSMGHLHVLCAPYLETYLRTSNPNFHILKYLYWNGNNWYLEWSYNSGEHKISTPDLKLDSQGTPHIFWFESSSGIKHAYKIERVENPTLIVKVSGSGKVTSEPDGINCPNICTTAFAPSSEVTLYAQADEGYRFSGWSGDCAGCGNNTECTITMDSDKTCTAGFEGPYQPKTGDVTGDGNIDIIDALAVARYVVGLQVNSFHPEAADVNCNGKLDIIDALSIARKALGLPVRGWCGGSPRP